MVCSAHCTVDRSFSIARIIIPAWSIVTSLMATEFIQSVWLHGIQYRNWITFKWKTHHWYCVSIFAHWGIRHSSIINATICACMCGVQSCRHSTLHVFIRYSRISMHFHSPAAFLPSSLRNKLVHFNFRTKTATPSIGRSISFNARTHWCAEITCMTANLSPFEFYRPFDEEWSANRSSLTLKSLFFSFACLLFLPF